MRAGRNGQVVSWAPANGLRSNERDHQLRHATAAMVDNTSGISDRNQLAKETEESLNRPCCRNQIVVGSIDAKRTIKDLVEREPLRLEDNDVAHLPIRLFSRTRYLNLKLAVWVLPSFSVTVMIRH